MKAIKECLLLVCLTMEITVGCCGCPLSPWGRFRLVIYCCRPDC